ncbi:MAG: chromate efflux transporter [Acidimicrobiales bacterium]
MPSEPPDRPKVPLGKIALEWGRIGCIGFGGPPAHITLLRRLCVPRGWLSAEEFEDGLAVANLMPGPASTQLAIFCAYRLGGPLGAAIGGFGFIVPGLVMIIALSAVFLASHPPLAVEGAAAGAAAVVPAIAVAAAVALVAPSWRRAHDSTAGTAGRARWVVYAIAGAVGAALAGPWLVLVIVACGSVEVIIRTRPWEGRRSTTGPEPGPTPHRAAFAALATHAVSVGGLGALAWEAFKVGALSFGGGFVIIPLMEHDAVHVYHFMSAAHFLDAVALGQVTPGPVVQTVAAVGYAAHGIGGALLAAAVAFAPSFMFVILGGPHFDRIRTSTTAQGFLAGAGPAAIGAIAGAAIPLGDSLAHVWQFGMLAVAAVWLIGLRRSTVAAILAAGVIGAIATIAGAPVGT